MSKHKRDTQQKLAKALELSPEQQAAEALQKLQQERIDAFDKDYTELCKKHRCKMMPQLTIMGNQISWNLHIVADQ